MAVPLGPHSITVKYNKLNTFCEIQPSNRTFDRGGIPYISHICMCLPKGRVLPPFWLKTGINFDHFGLESGLVFEELRECMNSLSFQFQMIQKERVRCEIEMDFKKSFCSSSSLKMMN